MADKTHIQWTDATWNPITGCSIVSKGCINCYAMQLAGTRLKHTDSRAGLTQQINGHHIWTGEVRFNENQLREPLRWTRPRKIFVCAHGDLFHENVPDTWIDRVFAVMALTPQHTYQVLTKRPELMLAYIRARHEAIAIAAMDMAPAGKDISRTGLVFAPRGDPSAYFTIWPLPNVWLGVSIEDQATAHDRIPHLIDTPAAIRFLSAEPLLGPIDLSEIDVDGFSTINALKGYSWQEVWDRDWSPASTGVSFEEAKEGYIEDGGVWPPTEDRPRMIDWVICGGESGAQARPMHPDWARSLRDQCQTAGVPFFFKQWGEWSPTDRNSEAAAAEPRYGYVHPQGKTAKWPSPEGAGEHGPQWLEEHGFAHMSRLGKKAAGDLLDGAQHHNWPEVRS